MEKEIGSNFELEPATSMVDLDYSLNLEMFGLKGTDSVFLSSGRGATSFVLDTIFVRNRDIKKRALIPSYTCDSVIEPFSKHNYQINYYPVNDTLQIDLEIFRKKLIETKSQVVLIHRYFGFETLKGFEKIIKEFSKKGVVFIEDRTQCLYSNFNQLPVDYLIGSLRKWAGLPDGGIAACTQGSFDNKPIDYDKELERIKLSASYAKHEYLNESSHKKTNYLDLFNKAEQKLASQTSYFRISPSSVYIQKKIDTDNLRHRRRINYNRLYSQLKKIERLKIITPALSEEDVPLYLTLTFKQRDRLQNHLRLDKIYAPIIWPKPEANNEVNDEVQYLYDNVLSLPIDQRYDVEDMDRIVASIEEYFKNEDN